MLCRQSAQISLEQYLRLVIHYIFGDRFNRFTLIRCGFCRAPKVSLEFTFGHVHAGDDKACLAIGSIFTSFSLFLYVACYGLLVVGFTPMKAGYILLFL